MAPRVLAAWLVHGYTASGAVMALLAAQDIFQYRYREAFLWLALQIIVDATDGALARVVGVTRVLPGIRGAHLDDLVDYLTYVFVPALFVWRSLIVPSSWSLTVCSVMLVSSAYGFSRVDAKTDDHFFTGFPSYWNIVCLYLLLGGGTQAFNGTVLLVLAALVFVPIRYIYPTRTAPLRGLTLALGSVWAALVLLMIWRMPVRPRWSYWVSLVFPTYYVGLSLVLEWRRRTGAVA
jgi:phosphatidylcholine synthase